MTSSYAPPPSVPPRHRRRGGVVWPLILIFIGAVFLLQNTGYLPPNFWVNLWRLWPLVLVLIGVELLLAHRIPWLVLAGFAVLVLIGGAVVMNTSMLMQGESTTNAATTTSVQTDLGGASQAAVTVRFGAGALNVGPIESPAPNQLASMTYQGPPQLAPTPQYTISNGVGQLDYAVSGRPTGPAPGFFPWDGSRSSDAPRMDLLLTPNVPIASLSVQTGATQARLDLTNLRLSTLDMSIGAATAWIRFPAAAGLTTAHISGGASTLTLEIPEGVAAEIQHQGGLSTLNVNQSRFPQVSDGEYRSPDYDTAQNRVDITIETGVTTIQVN